MYVVNREQRLCRLGNEGGSTYSTYGEIQILARHSIDFALQNPKVTFEIYDYLSHSPFWHLFVNQNYEYFSK